MQKQSAFIDVVVRSFDGARQRRTFPLPESPPSLLPRENADRALPAFSEPPLSAWPQEDCANEPAAFFACDEQRGLWALAARVVLVFLLFMAPPSSEAAVREVGAIGLTVGSLERTEAFYTKVLPFRVVSRSSGANGALDELLGLKDTSIAGVELQLGEETITLTEHVTHKGRPIPSDSRSYDHWFQHIAIVVRDMDAAYEHLRRNKVKHVSTAPQTLPAWNRNAAGIKAFYFRDPEEHVLEIIWFPSGKGDPKWQRPTTNLFVGIDHTAIVVSDTDRSLSFYTNLLAMRVVGESENYGVEQEHLNQVFGARLRITALRAERGPGIEFLEYIAPPGGRPLPDDARANDLVFWHTRLAVNDVDSVATKLGNQKARFVSRSVVPFSTKSSALGRAVIVRDPDGHALQLVNRPEVLAEKQ